MVTFNCKITGNGNLKLSEQAQEILDLRPGDEVRISIHLGDEETSFRRYTLTMPESPQAARWRSVPRTGGL